jgi:alkylhydroperoxidase/carboxymuconolactone decarboxylase family protein YurZ
MTRELDRVFEACAEDTLSAKETHLLTLAAQLAGSGATASSVTAELAIGAGASREELNRVACMAACVAGAAIGDAFAEVLKTTAACFGTSETSGVFGNFQLCTEESLDVRTTHLVGLAACLAAGCVCAEAHIIQARSAGINEEELARVACIAACQCGLQNKYSFVQARLAVDNRESAFSHYEF